MLESMVLLFVVVGLGLAWILFSLRLRGTKREFWQSAGRWDRWQGVSVVAVAFGAGAMIFLVSLLDASSELTIAEGTTALLVFLLIADLWFTSIASRWHSLRRRRSTLKAMIAANPDSADRLRAVPGLGWLLRREIDGKADSEPPPPVG
ncbi:MAG: hypothetical protein AB7J35_00305 [Dehalococcoidia bacterium]